MTEFPVIRSVDEMQTESGRVKAILQLSEEYRLHTDEGPRQVILDFMLRVANPPVLVVAKDSGNRSHYTVPVIATEHQTQVGEQELAHIFSGTAGANVARLYAMMVLASPNGLVAQKERKGVE